MNLFKKDIFGRNIWIKKTLIRLLGLFFYPRFNYAYNCVAKGAELIAHLPEKNVLFIANHQTYFADVALIYQVMQNAKMGYPNQVKPLGFWKMPIKNIFYVAAVETMKSGILPRIMAYTGAILVKRTWREKGKEVKREVDFKDTEKIGKALQNGWVVSFPQGTTTPYAQVRKGTAHIIKNYNPVVVPIVVDGMRRGFDKKGLKSKKKHVDLKITIKEPLVINPNESIDNLVNQIADAIHQSERFKRAIPPLPNPLL